MKTFFIMYSQKIIAETKNNPVSFRKSKKIIRKVLFCYSILIDTTLINIIAMNYYKRRV